MGCYDTDGKTWDTQVISGRLSFPSRGGSRFSSEIRNFEFGSDALIEEGVPGLTICVILRGGTTGVITGCYLLAVAQLFAELEQHLVLRARRLLDCLDGAHCAPLARLHALRQRSEVLPRGVTTGCNYGVLLYYFEVLLRGGTAGCYCWVLHMEAERASDTKVAKSVGRARKGRATLARVARSSLVAVMSGLRVIQEGLRVIQEGLREGLRVIQEGLRVIQGGLR
eukprot:1191276-Prorocentrum_minimum.AAC.2